MPVAVTAEVIATRPAGPFRRLVLVAPGAARDARPGQVASLGVGGADSALVLRRTVPLTGAERGGVHGDTVEVVVDPRLDPGLACLAARPVGAAVSVLAPQGRGFPLPSQACACLVVGAGLPGAVAPWLTRRLSSTRQSVRVLLTDDVPDARREVMALRGLAERADLVASDVATESADPRRVARAVAAAVHDHGAVVLYLAAGPEVTAAVMRTTDEVGVTAQVLLPVPMPCGTGLCGACEVSVRDSRSQAHEWLTACVHGPVVRADRLAPEALLRYAGVTR